jgi:hypothetical protein
LIKYKTEEEQEFIKHYASELKDELTIKILNNGQVEGKEEAIHLSRFFWKMVDASVEDSKNNIKFPWVESTEFLTEKIMYSISGYLERAGYSKEWENISDEQDIQEEPKR